MKIISLFKYFSPKERVLFLTALFLFLSSLFLILLNVFYQHTKIVPIEGGVYTEGIIGQPSLINPILATSEIDKSLANLVFANLKQLAEKYELDETKTIWHYRLKNNLFWHDNTPITTDDIIFTIEIIQNQKANSYLFNNWKKVAVKRISEKEVEFILPAPYVYFKKTLESLQPLPAHIFKNIPLANLRLSDFNLKPIGSGSFQFEEFKKEKNGYIKEMTFKKTKNAPVFLDKIIFKFYPNKDELVSDFNAGKLDGFFTNNFNLINEIVFPYQLKKFKTLKYYAIFINQLSNEALLNKNIRRAMALSIDKKKLIKEVLKENGEEINGPIIDWKKEKENKNNNFSQEEANKILDEIGFSWNDNNIREKQLKDKTITLDFYLLAPDIFPLKETAEFIKKSWESIGININIISLSLEKIKEQIKNRNYQMLLFGHILEEDPDLFSFWHSSQIEHPGLNLSLYKNKTVDKLIEKIRETFDDEKRQMEIESLKSLITNENPAIFLYSPYYFYVIKNRIYGIKEFPISHASQRFENINQWYINVVRVFK